MLTARLHFRWTWAPARPFPTNNQRYEQVFHACLCTREDVMRLPNSSARVRPATGINWHGFCTVLVALLVATFCKVISHKLTTAIWVLYYCMYLLTNQKRIYFLLSNITMHTLIYICVFYFEPWERVLSLISKTNLETYQHTCWCLSVNLISRRCLVNL